jgi:hypothetical protein
MSEGRCHADLRTHTIKTRWMEMRPKALYHWNYTDASSNIDSMTVRVLEGFLTVHTDVSNAILQLVTDVVRVHFFIV